MRIVTFAAMATIAVGLGGCATLDEGQCLSGDWYGIGRTDGASGFQRARLDDHAKACAKHGAIPDAIAYDRGRAEGLTMFCTPPRGFEEARQGRSYGAVCPASLERDFLEGFADGELVHASTRRLNEASSERTSAGNRERDYERQIREEERRLSESDVSSGEKDAIRTRLRRLRDDRSRAREDERRAERRERDARYEVEGLRAQFTPIYGPW